MRRVLTLAGNDLRMLYRTGYLWATLAVFALLLLIAGQVSRLDLAGCADVVAAIILFGVVLTPVMIIGLMVLLKRGEGSFVALAVTPMQRRSYVLARTVTISLSNITEVLLPGSVIAYETGPRARPVLISPRIRRPVSRALERSVPRYGAPRGLRYPASTLRSGAEPGRTSPSRQRQAKLDLASAKISAAVTTAIDSSCIIAPKFRGLSFCKGLYFICLRTIIC